MYSEELRGRCELMVDQLAQRLGIVNTRRPFHARLSKAVAQAMRHGGRSPVSLRSIVVDLARHARAAGVPREDVRIALVGFINEHPLCYRLDRVSLYDGRRASERLAAEVSGWVDVALKQSSSSRAGASVESHGQ